MADVFGSTGSGFGGAFKSTLASFTLSGTGTNINQLLVTNVQANYTQPISRIYELQSSLAYFVVGRPEGNGSIGSVFGPKNTTAAAYSGLANPCNNNVVTLSFSGANVGCASDRTSPLSPKAGRQLNGVVMQSLGMTVNAQDMMINENLGIQFASMEVVS